MLAQLLQLFAPLLILFSPMGLIGCAIVTIWRRFKYRLIIKTILRIIDIGELNERDRAVLQDKLADFGTQFHDDR